MKAIFSRKGYDTEYGKFPSIILPKGDMISFPIPVPDEIGISSEKLKYKGKKLSDIFIDLGHKETVINHHVDPDLGTYTVNGKTSKAVGIFGQASAASGHLDNQGVGKGDIFLFFGTFQNALIEDGCIKYDKTIDPFHALFGYLIIDDIVAVDEFIEDRIGYKRLSYHPHFINKNGIDYKSKNRMYVSHRYGTFKFSDELRLTNPGCNKSVWKLPKAFENTKISYHEDRGELVDNDFILQTVGKGQEFVFDVNPELQEWIQTLIRKNG